MLTANHLQLVREGVGVLVEHGLPRLLTLVLEVHVVSALVAGTLLAAHHVPREALAVHEQALRLGALAGDLRPTDHPVAQPRPDLPLHTHLLLHLVPHLLGHALSVPRLRPQRSVLAELIGIVVGEVFEEVAIVELLPGLIGDIGLETHPEWEGEDF